MRPVIAVESAEMEDYQDVPMLTEKQIERESHHKKGCHSWQLIDYFAASGAAALPSMLHSVL